jgi:amidase
VRHAGAIILAKTWAAHTIMLSDTLTPLWDPTANPYNRCLTVGANSGGEAALIALHGSPIAFSTDMGGGIRVPAA